MAEQLSVTASRSARFRELLRKPPFVCMGAHDAVTAKLAEQAGAPAIYVSGFVASAIVAGAPDFGVLTQTEMFEHIRRICRVTKVPVFADADTGYGNVLDAQRTIQLWEEAGASVLHLEDQAMPKKCGHFAGKQLIGAEEMQQKLRAMLAARRDPDFFIVARTDAMGVTDLDDALRRLEAYAAVGVDGLYVDAPRSVEQLQGNRAALEAARPAAAVQHGSLRQEPGALAERGPRARLRLRDLPRRADARDAQGRQGDDGDLPARRLLDGRDRRQADDVRRVQRLHRPRRGRQAPEAVHVLTMADLLVTRREDVAVLTLNRPDAGNRLTTSLADEIAQTLEAARGDDSLHACVLTGAGDVFCLGGDYQGAGPTAAGRKAYARALLRMDAAMAALGKPLVAAVNGDAHAGGFSVVVACDLAVAATHATFGLPEAARGLFPFIALAIVKDALPKKVLFDLVYSARLMPAAEALSLHLVNEVTDRGAVLERALERARQAGGHRMGVVTLGRDLYYAMRGSSAEESLEQAERALLAALELD